MNERDESGLSAAARTLLAQRATRVRPAAPEQSEGPLSEAQMSQWLFARLHPDSTAFLLEKRFLLHGSLEPDALRTALQDLVARHAALRTTFHLVGDLPIQRIQPTRPVALTSHDLRSLSEEARDAETELRCNALAQQPFDLAADQLLRALLLQLESERWLLVVQLHHIAFDGWSTGILIHDLEELYRAARSGHPASLPALRDGLVPARPLLQPSVDAPDSPAALDVPVDFTREKGSRHRMGSTHRHISQALWEGVQAVARELGCSDFAVAAAALGILVSRRCGGGQTVLGILNAGRTTKEQESRIGNFVTQFSLPIAFHDGDGFRDLVLRVRERSAAAVSAGDPGIGREAGSAPSPGASHLPVTFNFRNFHLAPPQKLFGCEVIAFSAAQQGSMSMLDVDLTPGGDGAELRVDYDVDRIAGESAERWADGYLAVLESAIGDPSIPYGSLPVAAPGEMARLALWNSTAELYDTTATLASLFNEQVQRTPDLETVRAGAVAWSYRELDHEARRIATLLAHRGIGAGDIVGICQHRTLGLVASMVGITLTGAAYLPLDPDYPAERLKGMMEDASLRVVLTGEETPETITLPGCDMVRWNASVGDLHISPNPPRPDDPAYILFTSGSTGRPKGVVIPHRAIVNHIEWMRSTFPMDSRDAVLQKTSISFDASIWEFWAPLLSDARLVMAPHMSERDPAALLALIQSEQISVLQLVPGMLRAMLEDGALPAASSLRLLCVGGEAMTWDLVQDFRRQHGAVLVNLYGPTEAAIDATFWVADRDFDTGPVPIGRPIANARIHVVDPRGAVVPIGTPGEICVAGSGVGMGYLGQPGLTEERFVPEPGHADARMYRTGDRGRWRYDGVVEYGGRLDHQVKFRGFRIELEEIDVVLMSHPMVKRAVTIVARDSKGGERLVTYLVPSKAEHITDSALRDWLRITLPEHMVPAAIVRLDALPLTPSGKIDRKALPHPPTSAIAPAGELPEGPIETLLAACWQEILPTEGLGRHTSFLDVGGHSLLAVRYLSAVERVHGASISLADFLRHPTIAAVAGLLAQPATVARAPITARPRRAR